MRRPAPRAALLALPLVLAAGEPRDLGLSESAGARLAQIDVSLSGSPEALRALQAEDFQLKVNTRTIEGFLLDVVCEEAAAPGAPSPPGSPEPAPAPLRPPTWLVYLDQPHLSMAGRARALDMVREMLPALLAGGGRVSIVSNGKDLRTAAPFTADEAKLRSALDEIDRDKLQWDYFAALEEIHMERIQREMGRSIDSGVVEILNAYREDVWKTDRNLHRLEIALGSLAEAEEPKAALYFADTMRSRAGEHYLDLVGKGFVDQQLLPRVGEMGSSQLMVDRILKLSAALGIRLYTVQAEGLRESSRARQNAQDTLTGLALDTGGRAFVNGVSVARMEAQIRRDLGCYALLSFDPKGLPEDQPLPVTVRVSRPGVEVRHGGSTVIQSAGERTVTRLLAAFGSGRADAAGPLRAGVIPVGFSDGSYRGLLQVAAPGAGLPGAEWDLGASVVSSNNLREEVSAQVRIAAATDAPVVLEKEITFPPGPYEVVAVAREGITDRISSARVEQEWPRAQGPSATAGPLALLQRSKGAFSRNGRVRTEGSLLVPESEPVLPDRPIALVGLACRERGKGGKLTVTHRLLGQEEIAFDPIPFPQDDRCISVRDIIPEKTLEPGEFMYELRVMDGEVELARAERRFRTAPAAAAAAPPR